MVTQRSGVFDMFTVVIDDLIAIGRGDKKTRESNALILLTCKTFVTYDGRSASERSRVDIVDIIDDIRAKAVKECKELIKKLAAKGDTEKLELMYSRLADEECKACVRRALTKKGEISDGSKIEI